MNFSLGITLFVPPKTSGFQDLIINFLKNIFTSVLAPQIAIASLGGPGMIGKENNLLRSAVRVKSAFLQRSSKTHMFPHLVSTIHEEALSLKLFFPAMFTRRY